MTARKRVVIVDADDDVRRALAELGYEIAVFPSVCAGLAHELTNPLAVIVTNAAMIGEDLAELHRQLDPASPLRGEVALMAEAQADVTAAALRIQALVDDLRLPPATP